jgi:hypothetical protein
MTYLLTAVALLAVVLCLLDLVLTFGVIRRLREHAAALERLVAGPRPAGVPVPALVRPVGDPVALGGAPPVGRRIGDFTARTVDGEQFATDRLADGTVVVFVAADCASCRAQLPDLVRWAGGRDRAHSLVVIDAQVADPADLVAALDPVAQVIVEPAGTAVTTAFGATAFPAYCVVDGGRVTASSLDLSELPVAVARP